MQLFIEDLASLEKLHISFGTEYILSSNTGRAPRHALPSLTYLDLHTVHEHLETMRWLDLSPNPRGCISPMGPRLFQRLRNAPSILAIVRVCDSPTTHDTSSSLQPVPNNCASRIRVGLYNVSGTGRALFASGSEGHQRRTCSA